MLGYQTEENVNQNLNMVFIFENLKMLKSRNNPCGISNKKITKKF